MYAAPILLYSVPKFGSRIVFSTPNRAPRSSCKSFSRFRHACKFIVAQRKPTRFCSANNQHNITNAYFHDGPA